MKKKTPKLSYKGWQGASKELERPKAESRASAKALGHEKRLEVFREQKEARAAGAELPGPWQEMTVRR